jgi:hypothetical protein
MTTDGLPPSAKKFAAQACAVRGGRVAGARVGAKLARPARG